MRDPRVYATAPRAEIESQPLRLQLRILDPHHADDVVDLDETPGDLPAEDVRQCRRDCRGQRLELPRLDLGGTDADQETIFLSDPFDRHPLPRLKLRRPVTRVDHDATRAVVE